MNIKILAFGIAKDILGSNKMELEVKEQLSILELKAIIQEKYPEFKRLASFRIAVNSEYQNDDFLIQEQDEIAIIPPVAGG